MLNPILGIDTWSGQGEIDETVLKANGIVFAFARLNDMNGGHHKDTGFDKQWSELVNFFRAPYFVYNPWVSGQANFDWLNANMPVDAKAVAIDIEVTMTGYPSATYAAEVAKFEALVKAKWRYMIYTGEWFLSYLSAWNKSAQYWWAQYPYEFYPSAGFTTTWDDIKGRLSKYTAPANVAKCPGTAKIWQFSGDKITVPGNPSPMDLNVWLGTQAELEAFFGGTVVVTPPPTNTHTVDVIIDGVNVYHTVLS